jgi:hypothetical protein
MWAGQSPGVRHCKRRSVKGRKLLSTSGIMDRLVVSPRRKGHNWAPADNYLKCGYKVQWPLRLSAVTQAWNAPKDVSKNGQSGISGTFFKRFPLAAYRRVAKAQKPHLGLRHQQMMTSPFDRNRGLPSTGAAVYWRHEVGNVVSLGFQDTWLVWMAADLHQSLRQRRQLAVSHSGRPIRLQEELFSTSAIDGVAGHRRLRARARWSPGTQQIRAEPVWTMERREETLTPAGNNRIPTL